MSTTTLTFDFHASGALTDPAAVSLSSPAGTYGVTRADRAPAALAAATQACPCVLTTGSAHGFFAGEGIRVTGVTGMVELNGHDYYVSPLSPTTLALYTDAALTTPVDASAYAAYTGAGTATPFVVPDGAAMTRTATGLYSYAFPDPAPGLEYTYYVEVLHNGTTYHFRYQARGACSDGILLSEARTIVEQSVLWAKPGEYSPARLDRAIQFAGDFFMQEARPATTAAALTATPGQAALDLTPLPGFLPGALADACLTADGADHALQVVDVDFLRTQQRTAAAAGRPQFLAFRDPATALLYPTPDAAYPLTLLWHPPFTAFAPGTATDRTLNIPARLVRPVLWLGAAAALVSGEQAGRLIADRGWQMFLDYIRRVRTAANPAAGAMLRKDPDAYL